MRAGVTLVSTDPDAVGQKAPMRPGLSRVKQGSVLASNAGSCLADRACWSYRSPIQRDKTPFLIVHLGVRSTFLRASYEPWLRTALLFAAMAGLTSMIAAALLANLALNPIEQISKQLEHLGVADAAETVRAETETERTKPDAVVRVARSIDRLGEQMRTAEAGYTALRTNLDKMLDTLRDGVLLFTEDGRAAMASDAAAHFLDKPESELVGSDVREIFDGSTVLGRSVLVAFDAGQQVSGKSVRLEDGREVQFSLDRIHDGTGTGQAMGTLVTLRDVESAAQLEQELEVSRRLAAVGRLTAGVGHEVKNPINAMVVHLELLKSKLASVDAGTMNGAQRHVEILAGEMQRLDRVVQTLADFFPANGAAPFGSRRARPGRGRGGADRGGDGRERGRAADRCTAGSGDGEDRCGADAAGAAEPGFERDAGDACGWQDGDLGCGGSTTSRCSRWWTPVLVYRRSCFPRIFDLYFTTKPKGSGIGLAMTYRILQMHGGAMEVRSSTEVGSPDRGTTFTLRLPISAAGSDPRKNSGMIGRTSRMAGERV